ncbi:hypothetical protein K439DRAFT_1656708 [Ramaria rubella]|nr:hypothetical protein K439DRAFT_1656708 [Ramaria rubella]
MHLLSVSLVSLFVTQGVLSAPVIPRVASHQLQARSGKGVPRRGSSRQAPLKLQVVGDPDISSDDSSKGPTPPPKDNPNPNRQPIVSTSNAKPSTSKTEAQTSGTEAQTSGTEAQTSKTEAQTFKTKASRHRSTPQLTEDNLRTFEGGRLSVPKVPPPAAPNVHVGESLLAAPENRTPTRGVDTGPLEPGKDKVALPPQPQVPPPPPPVPQKDNSETTSGQRDQRGGNQKGGNQKGGNQKGGKQKRSTLFTDEARELLERDLIPRTRDDETGANYYRSLEELD